MIDMIIFYLKRDLILFNFNPRIVQFWKGLVKKILSPSIVKEIIELVNYRSLRIYYD